MYMQKVDNLIIGFGKAGKTLAAYLGKQGQKTVLVERSNTMYGGTCINVGCIPSKKLSLNAHRKQFNQEAQDTYYLQSVKEKKNLVSLLNKANYSKLGTIEQVEIVDGTASFLDEHTILVTHNNEEKTFKADRIFINTGSTPFIPKIEGLTISNHILTSDELMDLEVLPKQLTIIGGGFIGLEFAKTYAEYGSQVTILDTSSKFLEREDEDVALEVLKSLQELGITLILNAKVLHVEEAETTTITYEVNGEKLQIQQDYILVSTGRRPNIKALNLENAGVALTERGSIVVNEFLQTNKEHIFAMGDVNGGLNFTYISLDDFRIVRNFLQGNTSYSTKDRSVIPTSVFLNPTLSKVGLTEKEALSKGYDIQVFKLPVSMIPKAKIIGNQTGLYKAIVDRKTNKILGATIFAEESHEVINIIATAMKLNADYTVLKEQIFTHPTMAEALNDLFQ
ncbi:pyridine nucleotide-disulfide oxidoreductase [Erysipelotrichaceae bacterium OH741_COT-311]|nr:pyridine nucleotide-disulfide oxidoreductase [Erysipelotrichaceae bacterium OH741_COT-311]